MGERRFDYRLTRAEFVELSWQEPAGETHQRTARLMDISASGAGIFTQRPLPVRTTITLTYQDQQLSGNVKHCVLAKPGYLLGIEFHAESQWSRPQAGASIPTKL